MSHPVLVLDVARDTHLGIKPTRVNVGAWMGYWTLPRKCRKSIPPFSPKEEPTTR